MRRRRMIRYTNQAVKEIVTGILIYGFVCTLIILFFVEGGQLLSAFAGLALGIFGSAALLLHMTVTLESTVDTMDEHAAKRNAAKSYVIRSVVFIAAFAAAFFSGIFNMLAVLAGLFGLKIGTYLQPLLHKLYQRKNKSNETALDEPGD